MHWHEILKQSNFKGEIESFITDHLQLGLQSTIKSSLSLWCVPFGMIKFLFASGF